MSKGGGNGYLAATRHPWPSLMFVAPLLLLYEGGAAWLGRGQPEAVRAGVDLWVRCAFSACRLRWSWLPPALLLLGFGLWAWRRRGDRPRDHVSLLSGMVLESVAAAIGLWLLSRALAPLLEHLGVELDAGPAAAADSPWARVLPYLGAGVWEETLFRLALFSAMFGLLRALDTPTWLGASLAALGSATLFAAAHHVGPNGQAYANFVFLFRMLAGVYFAALFQLRGYGVAVGAHACYNIMISVGVA